MILIFDIGNTHTHIGLADGKRVLKQTDIPTLTWFGGGAAARVKKFAGPAKIEGAILCSVVPRATPLVRKYLVRFGAPGTVPARTKKTLHRAGTVPSAPFQTELMHCPLRSCR